VLEVTGASPLPVAIRAERASEHGAIREVIDAAFDPDTSVGRLVAAIRASPRYVAAFALVAVSGARELVGFAMLSHADLVDDAGDVTCEVLTLSPVAVAPSAQRRGVGSALVREALRRAARTDESLVVVEGHPAYYPRFGFEAALRHDVVIELPEWAPPEAAMVLRLPAYTPRAVGTVTYPPAFDEVVEH